jgi:outer membrane protein OmpA-like peptidoglycan-associated protein
MTFALKTAAGMAALSFALAGCASAPDPSPRLLAAESSLQMAQRDPDTNTSGRAPLDKAQIALVDARDYYMRGKEDAYTHSLRMGEGYVALATAQGDQLEANRKITTLNKERAEVVSEARKREVNIAQAATAEARADTATAEARAAASAQTAAAAVADSAAAKNSQLAAESRASAALAELASYEQKKTDLGVTLILRDLQFASGSTVLTAGAQGRLAPLVAFLGRQPETKIQIAGHTDSQGTTANNMTLSTGRAQAVGAYLTSTGVNAMRISAVGEGEGIPVATNDTAAGRAINRRVEVTILN